MGFPSPVRAIAGYVALSALLGVAFGLSLVADGQPGALVVAVGTAVLGSAYALQASLRLRRVLAEFASQVPGDPTPEQSRWNDQSLHWEDPPLSVEGTTAARGLRLSQLTVRADGRTRYRSPIRAREAAREALDLLDRRPDPDGWAERLPSPDPVHSAVRTTGLLAAFVPGLFLYGGVVLLDGTASLAVAGLGVVAVVLAGLFRWATLRRLRTGFRTLNDGLATGGVRTRWIDFEGGLVRPRYRLHADAGSVTLRGTGHPWGTVTPALESVDGARLPDLSDCGLAVADALRDGPARADWPDCPPLSVHQRGAFVGVGAVMAAFCGALLASGSLGPSFLVGSILGVLAGIACLIVGVRGRVPFGVREE